MLAPNPKAYGILAALVVGVNVLPFIVMTATRTNLKRVSSASKPGTPPAIAFQIVWPILYTLIAVSLWMYTQAQSAESKAYAWTAFAFLLGQMALNAAWAPLYAQGKTNTARYLLLGMLAMTLVSMMVGASSSPVGAALSAPYFVWLLFALQLSA